MEQSISLKRTYIKITLLTATWGSMVLLRAMIVIPDEPAPIQYVYQRPEKKAEKKIEQRDTVYMLTGDWFFFCNFQLYNYPFNGCGGVIYMDQWGYPGYGYPSWGGYPLGYPIVLSSGVDSSQVDSTDIQNVDSVIVASNGPLVNVIEIEESKDNSKSFKQFIENKRKERLERKNKRKEKRMLRKSI
ncbi:MAG: hypothetical protein RLZZ71_532 [Bacteroidota bacterium]|jgi:hypothetical protein